MSAKAFAWLGVGLIVGFCVAFFYFKPTPSDPQLLVWTYTRNTGPRSWPAHATQDPSQSKSLTDYAVETATDCRLREWKLESSEAVTDIDVSAQIWVAMDDVSNAQFACLADRVRPPYVTLKRMSADSAKRTRF